jgi:hypothetical protein
MVLVRGRQGRMGLREMSLSTFCDIVWVEIWDDVGAMGDRAQYHRIIEELFLEGKDPYDITYETTEYKNGKSVEVTRRLSEAPSKAGRANRMKSEASVLEQWKARAAELKAQQAAEAEKQ